MKKINFNYLDVRRLDNVFTYFLLNRSKEVSKDKLKNEMELQERFWLVQHEMKEALKTDKKLFLVLSADDPYLVCKRCGYRWLPRSSKLPRHCSKCNSPYWNKDYQRDVAERDMQDIMEDVGIYKTQK